MHRKQIVAMETWPLNTLENKEEDNQESEGKGANANGLNLTTSPSEKPKKSKIYDGDDDDEQPIKVSYFPLSVSVWLSWLLFTG